MTNILKKFEYTHFRVGEGGKNKVMGGGGNVVDSLQRQPPAIPYPPARRRDGIYVSSLNMGACGLL